VSAGIAGQTVELLIATVAFPDNDLGFTGRVLNVFFLIRLKHKIGIAMRTLAIHGFEESFFPHFIFTFLSLCFSHRDVREAPGLWQGGYP